VWVAAHPIPRPGASAYHRMKSVDIGRWADLATAATRKQDTKLRALILALAAEARTSMRMTTAGETIARLYPGVGDQPDASTNMHWLADRGLILQDGEGLTSRQLVVPHYRLGREQ
jgi:hypothetical protein